MEDLVLFPLWICPLSCAFLPVTVFVCFDSVKSEIQTKACHYDNF